MKVNYNETQKGLPIRAIICGQTFITTRTNKVERALYMKIDANSGIMRRNVDCCYAVNLETGQIREFNIHDTVEPKNTIVNFV